MRRRFTQVLIGAMTAAWLATPGCHQPKAADQSPLQQLRAEFRPSYDAARDSVNEMLSPLVVVRFSDLYLIRNGRIVAEDKGIPRKYHIIHRTGHVPLVVYLKLEPHFGQPISDDAAKDLARYRNLIAAARKDLCNYGFTEKEIAWQHKILEESCAFLDQAQTGAIVDRSDFEAYRSEEIGATKALADAAGAAQIDATHQVMEGWRKELFTPDEWNELCVIIVGPRQPRHNYSAAQYFSAILPSRSNSVFPNENRRVYYVESLDIDRGDRTFEKERRAVATMKLDELASGTIFHDPRRMSVDVMADGARHRIKELGLDGPVEKPSRVGAARAIGRNGYTNLGGLGHEVRHRPVEICV